MDPEDELDTCTANIRTAIEVGDVIRMTALVNKATENELNFQDSQGFTILHMALQSKSKTLEILDVLLTQPSLNKNARSSQGETPLLLSLSENCNDEVIMKLIESGCDVQISNSKDVSPLSLVVKRSSIEVAHSLIKNGADPDAYDSDGYTPLHEAVAACNYEAVCMLLYYNASVNETTFHEKETPFMLAIKSDGNGEAKFQKVLFDYVADFTATNSAGNSIPWMALTAKSSLSKEIVLSCESIDDFFDCVDLSLFLREMREIESHDELSFNFWGNCYFNAAEFIDCLLIILNSKCAAQFVKESNGLSDFIEVFVKLRIDEDDRVTILYKLFMAEMPIYYFEFASIYETYGFNKELETIFLAKPNIRVSEKDWQCSSEMAWNIFHSRTNTEAENNLNDLLTNACLFRANALRQTQTIKNVFDYLRFFTIKHSFRRSYVYKWFVQSLDAGDDLVKKIGEIKDETLVELCRDTVRNIIIFNKLADDPSCRDHPYVIYDAVKQLPVPKPIRDILLFGKALFP